MTKLYAYSNYLGEIELPRETVEDATQRGDCYESMKFWQQELGLNLDKEKMILELLETGAWDREELESLDQEELEIKVIWVLAGQCEEDLQGREQEGKQ